MVRDAHDEEPIPHHLPPKPPVETEHGVSAVGPQHLVPLRAKAFHGMGEEHAAYACLLKSRLHSEAPEPHGPRTRALRSGLRREAGHSQERPFITGHAKVNGTGHVVLGETHVGVRPALAEHAPAQVMGVAGGDLDDVQPLTHHGHPTRELHSRALRCR